MASQRTTRSMSKGGFPFNTSSSSSKQPDNISDKNSTSNNINTTPQTAKDQMDWDIHNNNLKNNQNQTPNTEAFLDTVVSTGFASDSDEDNG